MARVASLKHPCSSALFGCGQADAVCPLIHAFGRVCLYVKIHGNGPGGSTHIGQGDRSHEERRIHLCFQCGGMECCLSFLRLAVMCLMWSLQMELLKYTSVPKNVTIKAVLF